MPSDYCSHYVNVIAPSSVQHFNLQENSSTAACVRTQDPHKAFMIILAHLPGQSITTPTDAQWNSILNVDTVALPQALTVVARETEWST